MKIMKIIKIKQIQLIGLVAIILLVGILASPFILNNIPLVYPHQVKTLSFALKEEDIFVSDSSSLAYNCEAIGGGKIQTTEPIFKTYDVLQYAYIPVDPWYNLGLKCFVDDFARPLGSVWCYCVYTWAPYNSQETVIGMIGLPPDVEWRQS